MSRFSSISALQRSFAISVAATLLSFTTFAHALSCPVITTHTPNDAETAYLKANYDQAATLYEQQLTQKPNDPALTAHLAEVLLRQQKLGDAYAVVQKAVAQYPNSAALQTALGEVQNRQGMPWLAGNSAIAALKLDPCYPRAHLLEALLLKMTSNYASSAQQIDLAHTLDPYDPLIRLIWLNNQPVDQQIVGLQAYIATETGNNPDDVQHLKERLEQLQKYASEPHKSCTLVSKSDTASIPFENILRDATHVRAYGLQVNLNDYPSILQVDTGGNGILISRTVAEHAGLKRVKDTSVNGIGDDSSRSAYTAYADNIKIGSLEFHDCNVLVLDKGDVVGNDGIIGTNVFSRFLITLDYPGRKMLLGPLPKRPDDITPLQPALETSSNPGSGISANNIVPAAGLPAKSDPPKLHNRYIAPEMKDWTSVYRISNDLIIPASLNNSPLKLFILDTGAFTTSISPNVAREITKVREQGNIKVLGINGEVAKVFVADEITFKFGNIAQLNHNVVAFDTSPLSKRLGTEISGLLGITTLGHMTISIDYRDGLTKFVYDPNRDWKYPK